jgi:hypothetical protein
MNKKQMVLAVLMIGAISTSLHAQAFFPVDQKFSSAQKTRVDKSYAYSLRLDNEGLLESALAVVTMIKLDLPTEQFSSIQEEINSLAVNGTTPVIRYKAYLAEAVFTNPSMFKEETAREYSDPDAFFSALAQRMTKTLLTSR